MSKCKQCNKSLDTDMLAMFTANQVCKACVKKNHNKATGSKSTTTMYDYCKLQGVMPQW